MAAPAPNYAQMAAGAGFVDHNPGFRYKSRRRQGNRTYDEAYTLAANVLVPIDQIGRAEVYSIVTFDCNINNAQSTNQVLSTYRVSRTRAVGGHVISSHFLNLQHQPNVAGILFDQISYDFNHYMIRILRERYVNDPRGTWAKVVWDSLLNILPGIISGLMSLFKAGFYHGDLRNGVALKLIDGKLVGFVYKMKAQAAPSLDALRREDIDQLIDLINFSINIGYVNDDVLRKDHINALSDTPLFRFLTRLSTMQGSSASPSWIVHDPLFWTIKEKSRFMKKLYCCLYTRRVFLPRHLSGVFNENWLTLCTQNDSRGLLQAIHDYGVKEERASYTYGPDITRFWRNGVHHFNERLLEKEADAKTLTNLEIVSALEAAYPFASHCHVRVEKYFLHLPLTKYPPPTIAEVDYFRSEMGW